MTEDNDQQDCVVVRSPCCKRVIFTAVNTPRVMKAQNYKEIGKMVTEGCTVEHMTAVEVRKAEFGCKCNKVK